MSVGDIHFIISLVIMSIITRNMSAVHGAIEKPYRMLVPIESIKTKVKKYK